MKPPSSEEEGERTQSAFHIKSLNIKGDNISSCVTVAATHRIIWRSCPPTTSHLQPGTTQKHNHTLIHAQLQYYYWAYEADTWSKIEDDTFSLSLLPLQQLRHGIQRWQKNKISVFNTGCCSWMCNYRLEWLHVMNLALSADLQQLSSCAAQKYVAYLSL